VVANTKLIPGDHTFYWAGTDNNGNAVAAGMYYYTIATSSSQVSKPMIFLQGK
jgi:flagellar hook assembly protein FlgD